jgi:hypothetical protein
VIPATTNALPATATSAMQKAVRRGMEREAMEFACELNHLSKPVMIGKLDTSGTCDVDWGSINPIQASVWSRYVPGSAKRTAD